MIFKKGDVVRAQAFVESGMLDWQRIQDGEIIRYPLNYQEVLDNKEGFGASRVRVLARYSSKFTGIVVGSTVRKIGIRESAGPTYPDTDWETFLDNPETIPVLMIEPTHTQRWLEPRACLKEDLTEI